MLKLQMPKRDIIKHDNKLGSALLKTNKKASKEVSRATKKTILKEEEMKNWTQTIILIAAFIGTGLGITFTSGIEYQKINNGIENNTKQLSSLIQLNKQVVSKQVKAQVARASISKQVEVNKGQIKVINDRVYNLRK